MNVFPESTLYSKVLSLLGKGKLLRSDIFVVSFTLPAACSFNGRFISILRQLGCAPNSERMSIIKVFGVTR